MTIDNETVIKVAACHECAARPGQPCIFARKDDPHSLRAYARKSHADRVIRAKKIHKERENILDGISL